MFENIIATATSVCVWLTNTQKEKMSTEKLPSEGEFVFPNGDSYCGSFVTTEHDGIQMHGYGVLTSKQHDYTYEGKWENDKMCGVGKLSMADSSVYEGEFVDSKFDGKGSLTWPDGSRYDGRFQVADLLSYYLLIRLLHKG